MQHPKSNAKGGLRDDLGRYFRSSWEANYARYLNFLVSNGDIISWDYEEDTFRFPVERGNMQYTPDFKITLPNGEIEYHEIKGWMDADSVVKIKRMAKYYPDIRLIVIDKDAYQALARDIRKLIPNWETIPRGEILQDSIARAAGA